MNIHVVKNFHLGPLSLADKTKVFLLLLSGDSIALDFLVKLESSVLDSIDGLAVIDKVISTVGGFVLALSDFGTIMTRKLVTVVSFERVK